MQQLTKLILKQLLELLWRFEINDASSWPIPISTVEIVVMQLDHINTCIFPSVRGTECFQEVMSISKDLSRKLLGRMSPIADLAVEEQLL